MLIRTRNRIFRTIFVQFEHKQDNAIVIITLRVLLDTLFWKNGNVKYDLLLWLIPSHIRLSRAFLITYTCQVKNTPHKTPCYYKCSIIRSDQRFANSYIDGSYSKQPHKPKLIPTNVNMIPGQRLNDWGKNTET